MVELGLAIGIPEAVEIDALAFAQMLEAGHVADGGVQPDVEILARGIGDLETEVGGVAGDVPVLQPALEPLLELGADLVLHRPLIIHPLLEFSGELAQLEEVVLRLLFDGRGAGDGRDRVLQLGGLVGGAALFAIVTILVLGPALGAGAFDEAVRQEHLLLRVEGLFDGTYRDMAIGLEGAVDLLHQGPILVGVGEVKIVEIDAKIGEIGLMFTVYALNQLFRGNALVSRPQHDRGAMGVVGADIKGLVTLHLLKSDPYIGLDVFHQVTQVDGTIGIGQGTGHQEFTALVAHG